MTVFAPALPNDDAFFNRFFIQVSGYRDTAGRPLHEVDFRAEENAAAFKKCPFHDSREGTLINHSALRQIMQDWGDIEHGLSFFAALLPSDAGHPANLARGWRISLMTMFAPVYLLHRKENRFPNGQIPTSVSGLFKIMLDVPTTFDLMFLSDPVTMKTLTGDQAARYLYNFANETTVLVNGKYACAGSPKLIGDIAKLLLVSPLPQNDGAWHEMFPDPGHFLRFSGLMTAQYAVSFFYQSALAVAMERLCQGEMMGGAQDDKGMPLAAYERRRRFVLSRWKDEENWEPALRCLQHIASQDAPGTEKLLAGAADLTLDFLRGDKTPSVADIVGAHDIFNKGITNVIAALQKSIHEHLGVNDLFMREVKFTREEGDHPVEALCRRHAPKGKECSKEGRA